MIDDVCIKCLLIPSQTNTPKNLAQLCVEPRKHLIAHFSRNHKIDKVVRNETL